MRGSSISPLRAFCDTLPPARRRLVLTDKHIVPLVATARLGERVGVLDQGMGMNLPPLFQKNQDLAFPSTDRDWKRLLDHVDWLGIKMLRYWLLGEAVMPTPGKLDKKHVFVKRLRHFDAWAQRRGGRLILDLSGMPEWVRFSVSKKNDPKVLPMFTGPRDLESFVEDFALPIARHAVHDLKLESVKYLCLFNEPFNVDLAMDTFYTPPGVDPFLHYVRLHALLRRRLNEEGIPPERLGLIGPNSHDPYLRPLDEMQRRGEDLLPHVVFMDGHAYRMRFDYLPDCHHAPTMTMTETIDSLRHAVHQAYASKKPFILTEYSSFYYTAPDGPLRHESTITEAEFVIRALAEGVGGALRYSLINAGETDGRWQAVNTADGSYTISPNIYSAYAVLARYAPRGGRLRRVKIAAPEGRAAHVHAVAIEYPSRNGAKAGGDITVLVVNDHPGETITFDLTNPGDKPVVAWQTDAVHKHRAVVPTRAGKRWRLPLPPMSVTALTTFTLTTNEPGLIEYR